MALRELIASFGIEVDDKELVNLDKKIDGFLGKVKAVGEILIGGAVARGLANFVEGQARAGAELHQTAAKLGLTTDALQAFQLAGQEAGASASDVETGLMKLNKSIGDAVTGSKEGAKEFADMGISLKNADGTTRNVVDVAADLADHLKGVTDQATRTAIAVEVLGRGGATLLPMFQEGSAGLKEALSDIEKLGGGMSEEFTKNALAAQRATIRFDFAMKGLKSRISASLMPAMTAIYETGARWTAQLVDFTKHTYVVQTGLMALGGAAVAGALYKILGLIAALDVEMVLAALPFIAAAAAVVVLYLAFDDLYTMIRGGDSVLGRLIDSLFGVGSTKEVIADLKATWQDLVAIWDMSVPTLDELKKAFEGTFNASFLDVFRDGMRATLMEVGAILKVMQTAIATVAKLKQGDLQGALTVEHKGMEAAVNTAVNALHAGDPEVTNGYRVPSIAAANSQAAGPTVHQQNSVEIRVDGAGDPHAVAKEVFNMERDVNRGNTQRANQAAFAGAGG